MENDNVEIQVVRLAMGKTVQAIKACQSPLFLALVKEIDTGNFYQLEANLAGTYRILQRFEKINKVDNKEFLKINADIVNGWCDRAKNRNRDDFTLLLDELIYILFVLSDADTELDTINSIYDFYYGDDKLPKSVKIEKNPLKIKINNDLQNTIHNERLKLRCNTINTIAVGLFMGGSVLPIVTLSFNLPGAPPSDQVMVLTAGVWAFVALGLHWTAQTLLGSMQQ